MRTVTKRELNQRTAAVLDEVTDAQGIVVTERGTPRWRVSAVQPADTTLERLEREGRYTPGSVEPTPWPDHPGGRTYTDDEADALLQEIRRDR